MKGNNERFLICTLAAKGRLRKIWVCCLMGQGPSDKGPEQPESL